MKKLFISYAHKDDAYRDKLRGHLASLERRKLIDTWDDHAIDAGEQWRPAIMKALEGADIIVLLISSDFIRSKFCFETEMGRAFDRWNDGKGAVEIIPVLVRQCSVTGLPFTDLQCLPKGLKPVKNFRDHDSAWTEVVNGVEKALKRLPTATASSAGGAPLHNLPPPNEHFTGRVDLLRRLGEKLAAAGGRVALTQAALHGLGGIGKTQIALKYATDSLDRHCLVWWLRAETEDTLLADLGALADRLGVVSADVTEAEVRARAALAALEDKAGWLLIYDNAETEQAVTPWLPRGGGAVILTSRDANWTHARPLDVEVMSPEDAVALIRERSGDGDGPAEELAQELGYLPLALEQAAAYMAERSVSVARYLDLYRERRAEVLGRGKAADYRETVATTWDISFQAVAAEMPAAGQLLNLCAFLAPDDIPLDLLRPGAKKLSSPMAEALADEVVTDDMVAVLRRHSLVRGRDQVLSLHRLVQEVLRTRLGDEAKDWAGHAVRLLEEVYRFDEVDLTTWASAERLLPQVEAATPHAEAMAVEWKAARWLLDRAGGCVINRGRFAAGIELRQRALAVANLPADDPGLAPSLANLASAYWQAGQVELALPLAERALVILEAQSPPDWRKLITALSNVATYHWQNGAYDKSLSLQQRAVDLTEEHFGPDYPELAIRFDNFAATLRSFGRLAEAEVLQRRAVAISLAAHGADHPWTARRWVNLAVTLASLEHWAEARDLAARGLAVFRHYHDDDHPTTQWAQRHLAAIDARRPRT